MTSSLFSRRWQVVKVASEQLEFRGISVGHLGMYFEELGGKQITEGFPIVYQGENWSGEILGEEEISFTSVFKVNAVVIRFTAEDGTDLDELIKRYRYKTTRIGG
ncbi:hypothetical protein [Mesobacillus foraminis]|uniref:hypothetical protein n=1 Tax=Mesobacillus foraminis TaxID=279826 RepID=UPI002034E46B|nr:hypothetical protein [Mesobacillus foraminis]